MRNSGNKIKAENFGEMVLLANPATIYDHCIKSFQEIVTLDQFSELLNSFNHGVEQYNLLQMNELAGDYKQYIWLDDDKNKAICVVFGKEGLIHRLLVKPYIKFPNCDNQLTRNIYSMPIKDEWYVFWGGKNEFLNYHYVYPSQRYAYDLVIMKDGKSYNNNRLRNENFYAFNKEVTAPANGKIIEVVNHIPDNLPGEMNEDVPAGNYVIIEHENKEYSLIAHFKQHSIVVSEGEEVRQGQLLGLCGNSGNSSEPHIHFQVMNKPSLDQGKSICIRFSGGIEPIQGDYVTPSPSPINNQEKNKLDTVDKVDISFSLSDFLLAIPRIIGSFFIR